ncbi:hypothetical protein HPT25_22710 [Bacillus sp. BRMEA1]|uniref:hypothetical protein n=1 Tax=Neobacillus endophyticus TaxID=2738405 RepID=UPI0015662854|nr:hypothetical protein [Neobacillus endophyticus]NRD80152.1 hypothetical protein [Neobacillus endophyticus]
MNGSYRDFAVEIAEKNKPAAEIKAVSGQMGVVAVKTNTVIGRDLIQLMILSILLK